MWAEAVHHPWGLAYEASPVTRACEAGLSLQALAHGLPDVVLQAHLWLASRGHRTHPDRRRELDQLLRHLHRHLDFYPRQDPAPPASLGEDRAGWAST